MLDKWSKDRQIKIAQSQKGRESLMAVSLGCLLSALCQVSQEEYSEERKALGNGAESIKQL